tara:strand:- start:565 stop:903 length:339 start_codon:yes stop_codon:yes gene_type:complete
MNKFPAIMITVLLYLGATTACSLVLPWQVATAITAGDLALTNKTGKSSSEHIAGKITGKQCQWFRLLQNKKACMNKKEYESYLLDMGCEEYTWNIFGIPSCKDDNLKRENIK